MLNSIRNRFNENAYAVLTEVPNGTGSAKTRSADALIMSLWPSRGLELIGVEIKVSRSDWIKELNTPAKAERELAAARSNELHLSEKVSDLKKLLASPALPIPESASA